jgi:hypothetical protein
VQQASLGFMLYQASGSLEQHTLETKMAKGLPAAKTN